MVGKSDLSDADRTKIAEDIITSIYTRLPDQLNLTEVGMVITKDEAKTYLEQFLLNPQHSLPGTWLTCYCI